MARITQNSRLDLLSLWSFIQIEAGKSKKEMCRTIYSMKRKMSFIIAKVY